MAMNKQRRTSNLNNIVRYDTSGNVSLPAGLTVEGLDAGFVKSDANGLFSIDTGAYLPTPSQSGNAGKYLTTDGSVLSWGTVPSVNIYNSNGTLTGNRVVTMGSYTLSFDKDILVNGLTIGRGNNQDGTNTAVGLSALAVSTAVNNTALGYAALQNNTTGTMNTALGRAAGAGNTTGLQNTYIGLNAGLVANGNGNTAIGVQAGVKLTTGGNNILLGGNAGFDLTTGVQNVIIGNYPYADVIPANTSNNILIGDGFGNVRIRAFNTGNVIINGSVDAGFKLDVIGTVRLYPRGFINGGFEFTFNDVYNIMHSGSHTYLSANQTMMVGAGNNSFTFIGVNKDDYITPVLVGYNSWQSNISSASAILDVRSTTRGFLQPRMTTTQRDAIATPATGLSVYNTTTNTSDFYNGTSWISGGINIYNSNGTLTGNRTVTMGGYTLSFEKDILVNGITVGLGNFNDNRNTALGYLSLSNAGNNGVLNTAVGSRAGASLGIGNIAYYSQNTFVGAEAGLNQTYGESNTAVGSRALQSNVSGAGNTAIGKGVLINNLVDSNVGIGANAAASNTTGVGITAIGTSALNSATTANNNTAIGFSAGIAITSSNNTIVGYQALLAANTGGDNTAIGHQVMQFTTSGGSNTGVGFQALQKITTGSNNTAIGKFAGSNFGGSLSNNNSTSSNSVYIGYFTTASANGNTNEIVIGYNAIGLGSNTTVIGNSSTVTSAIYGRLLLGTTTDSGSYQLDVNGTGRFTNTLSVISTATTNETAIFRSVEPYITIEAVGASNAASIFLKPSTSSQNATIQNRTGGGLEFYTGATPSLAATITAANNLVIGTVTTATQNLQITSSSADNHILVWGASAPSFRIDNAATGATQRLVFGLATSTNNFVTGSVAGDICLTTQSSSPLLFGANATEAMRISTSANILIKKTSDGGQPLQVNGKVNFASLPTSATGLSAGDLWNNGGVINIV